MKTPSCPRPQAAIPLFLVLLAALAVALMLGSGTRATAAGPSVAVFPIPGDRVANPHTEIAFRGVPVSQFGTITVTGSRSGTHSGTISADSDGHGGSFLPSQPFRPGERVTVKTALNILSASNGTFTFTVARPLGGFPNIPLPRGKRVRGDVYTFHTRPDLSAARAVVTRNRGALSGDIFLAPQNGPIRNGPMILGPDGRLVFYQPLPARNLATDVRVQQYRGQPALTWWQGYLSGGIGVGRDVIEDSSYHQIATVKAANGLAADLHEFQLTPQGTALITSYFPVQWDATAAHGLRNGTVLDSVVQEIDIPTGRVLFQWDSLDHVGITDAHVPAPQTKKFGFDYFHVNSVEPDRDGNLVVSGRNTWGIYKVDHHSAKTIWQLGGRHSSFKLGRGVQFAFQHDARVRSSGDRYITLFDDGGGPPAVHQQSQGLKLFLDFKHMTATKIVRLSHQPHLLSNFEGNYQQLSAGHSMIGWGQQSYFTEYNRRAQIVFDAHFLDLESDYRVYRLPWTGTPSTPPSVTVSKGKTDTVYVSWNGATQVASWRVLGGPTPALLTPVTTARNSSFETSISVPGQSYFSVQGLDSSGKVLGTSATVQPR